MPSSAQQCGCDSATVQRRDVIDRHPTARSGQRLTARGSQVYVVQWCTVATGVCCRAEATVVRCMVWCGVVRCAALWCGVVWCGVQADAVTPELNTTRYAAYWLRQVGRWVGYPVGWAQYVCHGCYSVVSTQRQSYAVVIAG